MKKTMTRLLALMLALLMTCPTTALAAQADALYEVDDSVVATENVSLGGATDSEEKTAAVVSGSCEKALPYTSEELLEEYYMQRVVAELYGNDFGTYAAQGVAYSSLTNDIDKAVYDALVAEIEKIVNGTRTSSVITITGDYCSVDGDSLVYDFDYEKVVNALLTDLPYHFFWLDKRSYGVSGSGWEDTADITFTFLVIDRYQNGSDTALNTTTASAANTAAVTASEVVDDASGDVEKVLKGFVAWICDAVYYNSGALTPEGQYGDPWQLIYVFDNDDTTNVVCEGYAKAFQHLCDLAVAAGKLPEEVACYTVTGYMEASGTLEGAGPHMWNLVEIGADRYIVDVTSTDSVGGPNLTMVATESDDEKVHVFQNVGTGGTVTYTYDYGYDFTGGGEDDQYPNLKEIFGEYPALGLGAVESIEVEDVAVPSIGGAIEAADLTVKNSAATATVEWYQNGTTATGTFVGGQTYTAKITVSAPEGTNFAAHNFFKGVAVSNDEGWTNENAYTLTKDFTVAVDSTNYTVTLYKGGVEDTKKTFLATDYPNANELGPDGEPLTASMAASIFARNAVYGTPDGGQPTHDYASIRQEDETGKTKLFTVTTVDWEKKMEYIRPVYDNEDPTVDERTGILHNDKGLYPDATLDIWATAEVVPANADDYDLTFVIRRENGTEFRVPGKTMTTDADGKSLTGNAQWLYDAASMLLPLVEVNEDTEQIGFEELRVETDTQDEGETYRIAGVIIDGNNENPNLNKISFAHYTADPDNDAWLKDALANNDTYEYMYIEVTDTTHEDDDAYIYEAGAYVTDTMRQDIAYFDSLDSAEAFVNGTGYDGGDISYRGDSNGPVWAGYCIGNVYYNGIPYDSLDAALGAVRGKATEYEIVDTSHLAKDNNGEFLEDENGKPVPEDGYAEVMVAMYEGDWARFMVYFCVPDGDATPEKNTTIQNGLNNGFTVTVNGEELAGTHFYRAVAFMEDGGEPAEVKFYETEDAARAAYTDGKYTRVEITYTSQKPPVNSEGDPYPVQATYTSGKYTVQGLWYADKEAALAAAGEDFTKLELTDDTNSENKYRVNVLYEVENTKRADITFYLTEGTLEGAMTSAGTAVTAMGAYLPGCNSDNTTVWVEDASTQIDANIYCVRASKDGDMMAYAYWCDDLTDIHSNSDLTNYNQVRVSQESRDNAIEYNYNVYMESGDRRFAYDVWAEDYAAAKKLLDGLTEAGADIKSMDANQFGIEGGYWRVYVTRQWGNYEWDEDQGIDVPPEGETAVPHITESILFASLDEEGAKTLIDTEKVRTEEADGINGYVWAEKYGENDKYLQRILYNLRAGAPDPEVSKYVEHEWWEDQDRIAVGKVIWYNGDVEVTDRFAANTAYTIALTYDLVGEDPEGRQNITISEEAVVTFNDEQLTLNAEENGWTINEDGSTGTIKYTFGETDDVIGLDERNIVTTFDRIEYPYGTKLVDVDITGGEVWLDGDYVDGTWKLKTDTGDETIDKNVSNDSYEYTAVFTPERADIYGEIETTVQVYVYRKPVNIEVDDIDTVTYTGNELKPTVTVTAYDPDTTEEIESFEINTDYTLEYYDNTDAGTARVYVNAAGNYDFNQVEKTFEIAPLDIANSKDITVNSLADRTWKNEAWTFDDEVKVKHNGTVLERGKDYTVSYSNHTAVGTATVTITGRGNYAGTKAETFRIVPAEPVYNPAEVTIKQGGSLSQIVLPGRPLGVNDEEVAGDFDKNESGYINFYTDAACKTLADDSAVNNLSAEAKTTLYWKFVPTDTNYKTITGSVTIRITALDVRYLTFDKSSVTATYGDENVGQTANLPDGGGTIAYASSDTNVAEVSSDGSVTIKSAGEATITASVDSDGTYAAATASYKLVVAPKPITAVIDKEFGAITKEYDGTAAFTGTLTGTLTLDGVEPDDTVTLTAPEAVFCVTENGGLIEDKNVDTAKDVVLYGFELTGAHEGNYKLSNDHIVLTGQGSITAKNVTIEGLTVEDKIYNGTTAATLAFVEDYNDIVFEGMVEDDNLEFDVDKAKATFAKADVGTDIEVTFSGFALTGTDAGNYILTAQPEKVTADITPRSISEATITLDTDTFTYTGQPQDPEVTVADSVTITPNDYEVTGNSQTDAGSYTLTVTGKGNYTGEVTVDYTIHQAENSWKNTETPLSITGWTYGDTANAPSAEAAFGEVIFEYSKQGEGSWSTVVPVDAGEYQVRATVEGNDNYTGLTADAVNFTIARKSIIGATVTLDNNNLTYNGSEQTVSVTDVILNKASLDATTDYTVSGNAGTNADTYTVTVTGTGNYTGTATAQFTINPKNIADSTIHVTPDAELTYNGSEQTQTFTVKDSTTLLTDKDYTVSNNVQTNAGNNYTATITGKGNYTSTRTAEFTIAKAENAINSFTCSAVEFGTTPDPSATAASGTDVTFTYSTTKDGTYGEWDTANSVGTYYVKATVAESNNYKATERVESFEVTAKPLTNATIADVTGTYTYNDSAHTPKPAVTLGDKTLVEGTDFEYTYSNNQYVGTATVNITGKGNYSGSATGKSFAIGAAANPTTVTGTATVKRGGNTVDLKAYLGGLVGTPTYTVTTGDGLVSGSIYTSSDSTGTATVTVTIPATSVGGDDTAEYKETTLEITINITDKGTGTLTVTQNGCTFGETLPAYSFTAPEGTEISETATYTGNLLKDNSSYNNTKAPTEAGTYTVQVVYETKDTIYTGTSKSFTIAPKPITYATVTLDETTLTYNGGEQAVTVTKVALDGEELQASDYTVSGNKGTDAKTYTVTVASTGNYTDTATTQFTIKPKNISSATISDVADQIYTGSDIVPNFTVTDGVALTGDKDYTIGIADNVDVGTATITVIGKGNYEGTTTTTFEIKPKDISNATITLSADSFVYDGSEKKPTVTSVVVDGLTVTYDADVAYGDNTSVGTATVKITGTGNFIGEKTKEFTITEATNEWTTTLSMGGWIYGSTPATPSVAAKFGTVNITYCYDGTTYVSDGPTSTTAAGTYTVKAVVDDTNDYTGLETTASFTVEPKSITGVTIAPVAEQIYTSTAITPTPEVKDGATTLAAGANNDFVYSYSANTNVGTATITITGKGNYEGTKTATFTIQPMKLSNVSIGTISNQTYNGAQLTPNVTVTASGTYDDYVLMRDVDYTVSYTSNINAGTGKVIVTAKDGSNYTFDNVTADFTIDKASYGDKSATSSAKYGNTGTVDLAALLVPGGSLGTPTLANSEGILSNTLPIVGTKLSFTVVDDASKVGKTATITVPVTSANYADYNIAVTVTVQAKDPTTVTVTQADGTYGTTLAAPVVTISDRADSTTLPTFTYAGADCNGTSYSGTTAPTLPGEYTVTATYEDGQYKGISSPVSFTIGKKLLVYDYSGLTIKDSVLGAKVYDGLTAVTLDGPLNYIQGGVVGDDEVTQPSVISAEFDTASIGQKKTITITASTLSGTDAWKYRTGACTMLGSIKAPDEPVISGVVTTDPHRISKQEVSEEVITEAIAEKYPAEENKTTLDIIKEVLLEQVKAVNTILSGNVEYLDLHAQRWNGTTQKWEDVADIENKSAKIFYPYPVGCNETSTIAVIHMNSQTGNVESLAVTKLPGGFEFTVDSFSPFAIAWHTPSTDSGFSGGSYYAPGHTFSTTLQGINKVLVDGKVIDSKWYTVSGTNVILSEAFLKTLSAGNHTIRIENATHMATATFTVKRIESAKTFDAGIALYVGMAMSSALGAAYVVRKKKEDQED